MGRINFDHELKEVYINMLKMASIIEQSMDDLIRVLNKRDERLANIIIQRDDEVDKFDEWLTEKCINIILKQQPVASDLRKVIASLKMVTDLERIADHCVDISEYVLEVKEPISNTVMEKITSMAEFVKNMVHEIINCFVDGDAQRAEEVAHKDDKVDILFDEIIKEMEFLIINCSEEERSRSLMSYILIVKYLERMADHVTNVSEWIVYQNTGEIDIHHFNHNE